MTRASGWRSATERETPSWSYAPSPVNEATGPVTWSSKGPTCAPSSTSLVVSSDATIRPVSASTPDVELAPGPAPLRAMLLDQPLPGPAELQTRAVHQQVHRFGIAVRPRPPHLQALRPAAQGGMVGNREIETEQTEDGADQPFGLAQGQAEYGCERQRRRDRQRRVARLTARRGAGLGVPSRDRRLGEPDCQAPTLAQGRIVFGPVRDPAPLFRDAVTAISIGLEWHRRSRGTERGRPPTP